MKWESRDYKWLAVVLLTILVGTWTFHYGSKDNEIVSYVSFAATVTSVRSGRIFVASYGPRTERLLLVSSLRWCSLPDARTAGEGVLRCSGRKPNP